MISLMMLMASALACSVNLGLPSGAASLWFSLYFPPSFWRVCGTSIVSVSVLGAVSLLFVLDRQERVHLFAALRNRFGLNKS